MVRRLTPFRGEAHAIREVPTIQRGGSCHKGGSHHSEGRFIPLGRFTPFRGEVHAIREAHTYAPVAFEGIRRNSKERGRTSRAL